MKICTICKEKKELSFFYKSPNLNYHHSWCFDCTASYQKNLYDTKRLQVLKALGDKCAWCGYDDLRALDVDHINNDGYLDRRKNRRSFKYQDNVLVNLDKFQLLCKNCNWIKYLEHKNMLRTEQLKKD